MRNIRCIFAGWAFAAAGLLLAALPNSAAAQTCNNTLIGGLFYGYVGVSVTSLAFGNYGPAAPSAQQSNFVISVACTGGLAGGTLPPFSIALNTGSGSFSQRVMKSGSNSLNYQIYTSAVLSTVWGDGTGSTGTVAGGNNGLASQTITGYGAIPAGQYVTPGSYLDTITLTLTY